MKTSTSYSIHQLNVEMDRTADKVLQTNLHLSYSRFYFLFVLDQLSQVTQHTLAEALGFSDPAVSKMAKSLQEDGLVGVVADPAHSHRRLITLNDAGYKTLHQARILLGNCFSEVSTRAGVDETQYRLLTEKITKVLAQKREEEL